MSSFILEYGNTIIYAIITAIFGYIGMHLKNEITSQLIIKEKKEVVKTCVLAANRMYKDKTGKEKYELAIENIHGMLETKNILITDFEIKLLIEEACESIDCSHIDMNE